MPARAPRWRRSVEPRQRRNASSSSCWSATCSGGRSVAGPGPHVPCPCSGNRFLLASRIRMPSHRDGRRRSHRVNRDAILPALLQLNLRPAASSDEIWRSREDPEPLTFGLGNRRSVRLTTGPLKLFNRLHRWASCPRNIASATNGLPHIIARRTTQRASIGLDALPPPQRGQVASTSVTSAACRGLLGVRFLQRTKVVVSCCMTFPIEHEAPTCFQLLVGKLIKDGHDARPML